ncbi:hypothetical protein TRFO_05115 [Tritrichomonas foetus]|uniref:Importin N-terminal domain-containing protein n=1 Tax=Tritrichomonas foetus TaxID=1144522 RepID=A0A1J4K8Z5_9EUKA|nr:hypothetical protein TRFO_05115 [Tritrichomonas foetus]|eukprot:OHT07969.1 hypothetical protein TRFO_05115 [Tritrichomonas foetus]
MINPETLVQCLTATFSGTSSANIQQAEAQLAQQYQFPEFPLMILQMLSSPIASNRSLSKAGIIQVNLFLLSNEQFLVEQSISFLHQLASILPVDLLPMIEFLSNTIVKYYILKDGHTFLFSAIQSSLASQTPIVGFILLNSLINLQKKADKSFYQTAENLFQLEIPILQNGLNNSPDDQINGLLLHYFAEVYVLHFIEFVTTPEQLIPYYQFSIHILQSGFTSPFFDVADDLLDIILNCFILYPESFDVPSFMNASISYFQKSPSFSGLTYFFQIMKVILCTQSTFSVVSSNLPQILQSFFQPIYQITEEDQSNFEMDQSRFLDSILPGIEEFETPRSSASNCLYEASKINPQISSIVFRLCLQQLSNSTDLAHCNPWQIFSALFFFSSCSSCFSENCEEFHQFLQFVSKQMQFLETQNIILLASSLVFLSNFPVAYLQSNTNADVRESVCFNFVGNAINVLASFSGNESFVNIVPLIQYLSSCAAGHLLSTDVFEPTQFPPDIIPPAIQNLFIISQQFPTERIASALSSFVQFFNSSFGQFSENCVTTLMQLLVQYMNGESVEARKSATLFSNAIFALCSNIQNPALFDCILNEVGMMIEERLSLNFCEEILPLIDGCVRNCKILTQQIISVPQMLMSLINEEGREEAIQIASICKYFALKFGAQIGPEILEEPIIAMMQLMVEDLGMYDEDYEAILTFCQILFILLPQYENTLQLIEEWAPSFSETSSPEAGDILAAMIHKNPVIILENEESFMNWISNSRSKSFLSSAAHILMHIQQLPENIQSLKPQIIQGVQQRLTILNSEEYDNDENDEFFNMETILAFYQQQH